MERDTDCGGDNGGGKICDFRSKLPFISETVGVKPVLTMDH